MIRIEITTFIDRRGGVLFRTRTLSEQRVELWRAGIIDSNAAIYPELSETDSEPRHPVGPKRDRGGM